MARLNWEDAPDASSSKNGKFKKWVAGKNRVRFVSPLIQYDKVWPDGKQTVEYVCVVMDLDDANKLKIANLKKTMLAALKNYKEINEIDPSGKDAPFFCVTRSGQALETRYSVTPAQQPFPVPAGLEPEILKMLTECERIAQKAEDEVAANVPSDEVQLDLG
jgi:hypothetical protein